MILLIIAVTSSAFVKVYLPDLSYIILSSIPVKEKFIGTCLLSFILGPLAGTSTNLLYSKDSAISHAIRLYGDDLEKLFLSCLQSDDPIQLTLDSGKVYLGYASALERPDILNGYIVLTPVASGYRARDDLAVHYTTNYLKAKDSLQEKDIPNYLRDLSDLVIRKQEVISATMFNVHLSDSFDENSSLAS